MDKKYGGKRKSRVKGNDWKDGQVEGHGVDLRVVTEARPHGAGTLA